MAGKQLDLITANRTIERARKNLERRAQALQITMDEMAMLEALEVQTPGAYGAALSELRTKRDRQNALVRASQSLIKAMESALKAAK